MDLLVEAFTLAWTQLIPNIKEHTVTALLEDVVLRYQEPWRHYHALSHVVATLEIEKSQIPDEHLAELGTFEIAVMILSTVYHDIVYIPGGSSNELLSACYFERIAREHGLPPDVTRAVSSAIRASRDHFNRKLEKLTSGAKLFIDADVSILATPNWDDYLVYTGQVFAEYEEVGIAKVDFVRGRIAFLEGVINKTDGAVFATEEFAPLNAKAWDNLVCELAHLREELPS